MVLKHDTKDVISDDLIIDEYESRYIKEMFAYIDDKDIKDAVYDSFYDSKKNKNLIFIYNDIDDESRRARVRILTRILWFNSMIGVDQMENNEQTTKKRGRRKKAEQYEQRDVNSNRDVVSEDVVSDIADSAISCHDTDDCSLEMTLANDTVIETPYMDSMASTSVSTISVGARYTLPFARLYPSSVSKTSICVCSEDIEILSLDVHDDRINVFDHGKNLKGWINISEIK